MDYRKEHYKLINELKKMREDFVPVEAIIEKLVEETDKPDSIIALDAIGTTNKSFVAWDEMGRTYLVNDELYETEMLYRILIKKIYDEREKYGGDVGITAGLCYNNLGIMYEKRGGAKTRNRASGDILEAIRCYERGEKLMIEGGMLDNVARINLNRLQEIYPKRIR